MASASAPAPNARLLKGLDFEVPGHQLLSRTKRWFSFLRGYNGGGWKGFAEDCPG